MATSELLSINNAPINNSPNKELRHVKVNILKGNEPMPFVARKYDRGVHFPECIHQHPEAEVCFMPWDNGVMLVDGMAHPFCSGDMFLIPGNTYHHPVFDNKNNQGLIVVYFSPLIIELIPPAWFDLKSLLESSGEVVKLEGNLEAGKLLLEMEGLLQSTETENDIICQGVFLHLMSHFAVKLKSKNRYPNQKKNVLIRKFSKTLDYIHSNLSSNIDIPKLHLQAGLSRSRFSEQFKTCFGITVTQCIQDARLEKSKHLLRSTSLSVSEIAYACGYNWPSFFNRTFKKSTSVSPSEFRRNQQLKPTPFPQSHNPKSDYSSP